jgi:hypothetical protein
MASAPAGDPQQHPPEAGLTLTAVDPGILDWLLMGNLHVRHGIVLADRREQFPRTGYAFQRVRTAVLKRNSRAVH